MKYFFIKFIKFIKNTNMIKNIGKMTHFTKIANHKDGEYLTQNMAKSECYRLTSAKKSARNNTKKCRLPSAI